MENQFLKEGAPKYKQSLPKTLKLRLKLISDTRMENKNTVWKCGIAMEKAWDGTILLVVFQHFSFARLNQSQDAKSYLLYGLICIPFSHIYLAYCGRALQTKIQFYKSLSIYRISLNNVRGHQVNQQFQKYQNLNNVPFLCTKLFQKRGHYSRGTLQLGNLDS